MKVVFGLIFLGLMSSVYAGQANVTHPDGYRATVRGTFYGLGGVKTRVYMDRSCDYVEARDFALLQCYKAGAEYCDVIEVVQNSCVTKCNCQ